MSSNESRRTAEKIAAYLVLIFALSLVFYYLIVSVGMAAAASGVYVLLLMWCPGTAALITQLIHQKNVRGLGWGWGRTRYQIWSYLIPLLYVLAVYVLVWLTGLPR